MNQPTMEKTLKKPVFYAITTLFLLTATSPVAAAVQQTPESGSIASLLVICLVSMGCIIFILSAMKHLNLTRKPRKSFYHPVLLDKLKDAQRIQLQKQITKAGQMVSTEDEDRKFEHPTIPQTEETEQVEELLHAMAASRDEFSDESI
jgi:hypothetical protein